MWPGEDAIRELSRRGPQRRSGVPAEARTALRREFPYPADAQLMIGIAGSVRIPGIRVRRQRRLVQVGRWALAFGQRVLRAIFVGQSIP